MSACESGNIFLVLCALVTIYHTWEPNVHKFTSVRHSVAVTLLTVQGTCALVTLYHTWEPNVHKFTSVRHSMAVTLLTVQGTCALVTIYYTWEPKVHKFTSVIHSMVVTLLTGISRCKVGTNLETSSNATCKGTVGHSHLSLLSHCGLILVWRVELVHAS